jgi:hypothetical protein
MHDVLNAEICYEVFPLKIQKKIGWSLDDAEREKVAICK